MEAMILLLESVFFVKVSLITLGGVANGPVLIRKPVKSNGF